MRAGSISLDLAAEAGGNVEAASRDKLARHDVTIIGANNLARSLPADASALFARNVYNFLSAFWTRRRASPCFRTTTSW